jgi:hypothetical protein
MTLRLSSWLRNAFRFGWAVAPDEYFVSRWLFLRLLGVVYLAAFVSLWGQIRGLIGSRGILPVTEYLRAVREEAGNAGYYLAPTLCWLDSSDPFLDGLCGGGAGLSLLLILGVAPVAVLFILWVSYLSLTVAGQVFLGYQWDGLLLETGFLAIFFAPLQLWPRRAHEVAPARAVLFLLRWLLFRVVFVSGVVKLRSGDESWRSLLALHYHYETQPLPTWTSWYMHQLPGWFQQLSVLFTFLAELVVPLLIFGPRRCRRLACGGIVALQLLIGATGNYGFFNLLTIALCLPLLDDAFFPARVQALFAPAAGLARPRGARIWSRYVTSPMAGGILLLSLMPFLEGCDVMKHCPAWLNQVYRSVASFRSVNTYGLFAIMTTRRLEIIVEGSDDGRTWKAYEFGWKPGDLERRPRFAGLHMPRLDWQMWFAALGSCQRNRWFVNFLGRLLEDSPDVLALLERNPFAERPPRYVRAVLDDYHFTNTAARSETGAWWRREAMGLYCPVVSLKKDRDELPR